MNLHDQEVAMMRLIAALLAVSLLACGGDSTAPGGAGPLALAIVSGQNQTVQAGSHQLSAPVVGQLVRKPDGTVAFRWMRAVGDAIVPTALAQTVVNGSPVPGAVVCAVSVDTVHTLTPFTPCTNTDSSGKATFFFTPGTVAGTAEAEIRGTVNDQPAVFDTAMATVLPGPADTVAVRWHDFALFLNQPYPLDSIVSHVADAYGNAISGAAIQTIADTGLTVANDSVRATAETTALLTIGSDAAHDSVRIAGLYDVRLTGWSASYSCATPRDASTQPDSAHFALTADSVVYGVMAPVANALNGTFWMYFSGTETDWKGGAATTAPATHAEWVVQVPDTLRYSDGADGVVTASSLSPRTYVGGHWCPNIYLAPGDVTLTATS